MDRINDYLAGHHGVVSREQALALGMSGTAISRMVSSGRWKRIARGMYRVAGAPPTWLGDARSLALSIDGLISHRAAARLWDIDGFSRARLEATVPKSKNPAHRPAAIVHRSTQVDLADATTSYCATQASGTWSLSTRSPMLAAW